MEELSPTVVSILILCTVCVTPILFIIIRRALVKKELNMFYAELIKMQFDGTDTSDYPRHQKPPLGEIRSSPRY